MLSNNEQNLFQKLSARSHIQKKLLSVNDPNTTIDVKQKTVDLKLHKMSQILN